MLKSVSVKWLQECDACPDGVELFRKHFGDGRVPITREGLIKAARLGLDMIWLAEHVGLPDEARAAFEKAAAEAMSAFWKAEAEARAAHGVPALRELGTDIKTAYQEALTMAGDQEAATEAWATLWRARDEAETAYRKAAAEALADAMGL